MMNVKTVGTSVQCFILAVMQDEIVTVVMKNKIHTSYTSTKQKNMLSDQDGKGEEHFQIISQTFQKFWKLSGTFWKILGNFGNFWKV